ncbi:MAG: alpha/beta fold hydrolase [Alphaproteobacteria bacterium]|nr:MAG: alpha/beta fold hydrolase [Alphaproteobacteria bacterium]
MKTELLDFNGQTIRTAIRPGDPDRMPILFLNGIGANLELALPLVDSIAHGDFITFDMPGVGRSPASRMPYRPWWAAKLAQQVLNHYGYPEVDLMGYSWGGGIAQQFATQFSNRVNRLVLLATSPGSTMMPGNLAALTKLVNPRKVMREEALARGFENLFSEVRDHAANTHLKVIPPQQMGYMMQLGAMAGWTSLPLLPFIKAPTLILTGDKDTIVPPANSSLLNNFIPRSQLVIIPGANHLFVMSDAGKIAPHIDDFLRE